VRALAVLEMPAPDASPDGHFPASLDRARLHPGASEVAVFDRWLQRSPLRPSRFLPLLEVRLDHAA
jgi:hypothetical protein